VWTSRIESSAPTKGKRSINEQPFKYEQGDMVTGAFAWSPTQIPPSPTQRGSCSCSVYFSIAYSPAPLMLRVSWRPSVGHYLKEAKADGDASLCSAGSSTKSFFFCYRGDLEHWQGLMRDLCSEKKVCFPWGREQHWPAKCDRGAIIDYLRVTADTTIAAIYFLIHRKKACIQMAEDMKQITFHVESEIKSNLQEATVYLDRQHSTSESVTHALRDA
jgi:hypothetical protein